MASPNQSPYRIYLVLDPASQIVPELARRLAPIAEVDPHLPGVEGFYDHESDAALFGLKFHRRAVERIGAALLIELVAECGLPVIAPEELPESEYYAFFARHLRGYPEQIRLHVRPPSGKSLIEQLVASLRMAVENRRKDTIPHGPLARGTGEFYDSMEIDVDASISLEPPRRARAERPSSRWDLDLDLDLERNDDTDADRPSSEWELVL